VKQLKAEFPVAALCRVLDVARSSVYYEPKKKPPKDLTALKEVIMHFLVTLRHSGVRYMCAILKRYKVEATRSQVHRAYVELGLLGKPTRKLKVRTTNSRHEHPRHPNLIRNLQPDGPDHIWAADVTFIRIGFRFAFLALVMDLHTRETLGWELSYANDTKLTLGAWKMALKTGRCPRIHHSDQGSNYASYLYVASLETKGVLPSMAAAGRAWENGYVERLNRTVKEEEVRISEYRDLDEARQSIQAFFCHYNQKRLHSALSYQTPSEIYHSWLQGAA
jgi:transposase InsO family protein